MEIDMVSNALVWLTSRLNNYLAAGESFNPVPAGDRSEKVQTQKHADIGISQQELLERWTGLLRQFDVWSNGLSDAFKPCARIEASHHGDDVFPMIWYSYPMCASTMQNYYMARILLMTNKPHETTAGRTTVSNRLESYRLIEEEVNHHSYEIWYVKCSCNWSASLMVSSGIAMSGLEPSARVHSLQPLFVAGQCMTKSRERKIVVQMLRSIEADLGWATEYRVQQLFKEWKWTENDLLSNG